MRRLKKLENTDDYDILPCPKCGARKLDIIVWHIKGVANRKNFAVVCPKCGYRLKEPYKFNDPRKAVTFWNKGAGC